MAGTTEGGTTDYKAGDAKAQAAAAAAAASAQAAQHAADQLADKERDAGLGFLDFVKDETGTAEGGTKPSNVETAADGTKTETAADGTTIATKADGTRIETRGDKSVLETRPDKSTLETKPDGSTIETKPDGTEVEKAKEPPGPAVIDEATWTAHPKTRELEERLKQTRDYSTQVNARLAALDKDNKKLQAQVDGTYDPDVEAANEPTKEQIEADANDRARIRASVQMAARLPEIGSVEKLNSLLFNKDAPFRKYDNVEWIQRRCVTAEAPALEALQVLREEQFFETYGRDPVKIKEKIGTDLRPTIEKEVRAALEQEFRARLDTHSRQIPSVGNGRGSDTSAPKHLDDVERPLSEFGNPGLA